MYVKNTASKRCFIIWDTMQNTTQLMQDNTMQIITHVTKQLLSIMSHSNESFNLLSDANLTAYTASSSNHNGHITMCYLVAYTTMGHQSMPQNHKEAYSHDIAVLQYINKFLVRVFFRWNKCLTTTFDVTAYIPSIPVPRFWISYCQFWD